MNEAKAAQLVQSIRRHLVVAEKQNRNAALHIGEAGRLAARLERMIKAEMK